jgi:hypothetical protein
VVENPEGVNRGVTRLKIDGHAIPYADIALDRDGQRHTVNVVLGKGAATADERT